jgi:DNA-binding MarR family transcriptional regulator
LLSTHHERFSASGRGGDEVRRIGVAWRELRRGASMAALRPLIYGDGPDALDLGQADALDILAGCGPTPMSSLAEALRVDASTATRSVDRLVERGLAVRRRCDDDARVLRVALTASGLRAHEELLGRRRSTMEAILAPFSGDERAVLADLLERLVAGVDRVAGADAAVTTPLSASPE